MSTNTHIESTRSMDLSVSRRSVWSIFAALVKLRLSMLVVITAIGAYLIVSGLQADLVAVVVLALGGFLVTAASNILNQVLEQDYDARMKRTMTRPLVTGEIGVSSAVFTSGLMCLSGVTLLAFFNVWAAFLGMLAFVLYAFLYTPLKRFTPLAVTIGAIAGAMPMLIGAVAYEGGLSLNALTLFAVQFFWQFPHFWSIAYIGNEDYAKADYQFIPRMKSSGAPSSRIAMSALINAGLLIPVSFLLYSFEMIDPLFLSALLVLNLVFVKQAFSFWKNFDQKSARRLMFSSLIFIPAFLLILVLSIVF